MNDRIINELLVCPVCGERLVREGGSLVCRNRHSFDISSAGYVNLAGPRQSGGGDSKELVAARSAFLGKGYYEAFADECIRLLKKYAVGGNLIDAGCGEGYYSLRAAEFFDVCGFDLSKYAIASAAKAAARRGIDATFAVAGIFGMSVRDGAADAVMNLFAPCAEVEFSRVLKKDGILLVAGAGEDHLDRLKASLYSNVTKNQPRADLPTDMKLIDRTRVKYEITLGNREDILSLFSMTPYYYRTDKNGREKLSGLDNITTTVDFDIFVYRK